MALLLHANFPSNQTNPLYATKVLRCDSLSYRSTAKGWGGKRGGFHTSVSFRMKAMKVFPQNHPNYGKFWVESLKWETSSYSGT